jgi:predicted ATPase
VCTHRSDELHRRHPLRPLLAELERDRRVERLELGRFDRGEVAAQLTGILGVAPAARLVERVHARSGGNAFFVEELAAAAASGLDGELPPNLRDTLLARIELLAEPTQQVLAVAAAAGARVDHDLLAEVAGLPEAELLAGLREAVSAHVLLVDAGDGAYGFRHALVKEAVYAELLPGERTRLHARFAAALAGRDDRGGPGLAAELAWHWYAAHDLERALPAAVEAGRAAERAYAFAEAQRQYERALELWDRVPDAADVVLMSHLRLLEAAIAAAYRAGDFGRAVKLIRLALAEVPHAAAWADRFTSGVRPSPKGFRRQAAPTIVQDAVAGIAQAGVPDPDGMLRGLLVQAIGACAAWVGRDPDRAGVADHPLWMSACQRTQTQDR